MKPMDDTQVPPPSARSVALYRRIVTLFLALTAGVVLLAVYVVFSRASVIVLSKQDEVKADILVDVARTPADGEVKGDVFEMQDSVSQTFPATSQASVDARAEGRVKITSAYSRPQTLIATTRLLTPGGVLFRIKNTVTVPANGSVDVDAAADLVGVKGEVSKATFTIPGLNPDLRKLFTATTLAPFVGGKKDARSITQDDVDKAARVLTDKLGKDLSDRLRQKATDAKTPKDGEAMTLETVSKTTDVPVGSGASEFALTVTVKATGVFYDKTGFDTIVRAKLAERLMEDHALLSVDQAAVTKEVDKIDFAAGRVDMQVSAKGIEILSPKAATLDPQKLTGITVDAAQKYLQSLDGVASASVRSKPFWVGRMPNVADHISVEVR